MRSLIQATREHARAVARRRGGTVSRNAGLLLLSSLFLALDAANGPSWAADGPSRPQPGSRAILAPQQKVATGVTDASGYIGVVFAYRTADVSSELTGVVQSYRIRLGDRLATGQTIASLANGPLKSDLAMAEAALRAAQAEETKAAVEHVQAQLVLERRKEVAWALSKEDLEGLSAREQLARASVEVARARVAEQSARVEKIQDDLAKCQIRAPFPGRIGKLHQSEGALVTQGTPIARLVADDDLWVRFAVPPGEAPWATLGKLAYIVVDESGHRTPARVEHVAPEVDDASGMVFAEARLTVSAAFRESIRPGMAARVHPRSGR